MTKRVAVVSLLALLAASVPVAITATPATAATVTVTTTSDVVDGADGLVSLREAVDAANAAAGDTVIDLAASGTYVLAVCGGDEDANAGGDLDYTGTTALTLHGNGSTIDQTCPDERVLDQLEGAPQVAIDEVTLTGGDSSSGAALRFNGDVVLTGVTVSGNDAATGPVLNSGEITSGSSIGLVDSVVGPNTGTGVRVSLGGISVNGSTITQNTGRGIGAIDGALSVADSTISDNGQGGISTTGQGDGELAFVRSTASGNGGPGIACSACGDLVVTESTVTGNVPSGTTLGGGIAWGVDQDQPTDARTATITDSTVSGNTRNGPGGGLVVSIVELTDDAPPAQIVIAGSTFSGNAAAGADGRGGGIHAITGEVRVTNSTFSGNSAPVAGGGLFTSTGDVFLQHATVVDNSAPSGANIGTGEDLDSFGSIVASPAGGGTDCAIAGTTISAGFNVGGDASCAFVAGPGDQTNVGDPQLGPLAANGGPTLTRLPLGTSPAAGAVPAASCTVVAVDQRGVSRPAGTDCEAGSVEIVEPVSEVCTKTGTPGKDVLIGGPGDDVLCGLGGADILIGGRGAEHLIGGDGGDVLIGGPGNDELDGGAGKDLLLGGAGVDDLDGGPGVDLCVDHDGGKPRVC
ncbi:choice-of-anchor Q domain-containing protein [Cellulomonas edaphi]|uniref:Right-handed parallel beta-helix repeat-containing protein n=1 Tax=Cellulomonas edaphi TaxID=3053468 RepID=A0ABT7S577_9CELL|nr:choice-of-anchor Q domain-containing protein [Cellulomons edaphi]MDM7830773.1 right-handed parallel beta-helix repeat-containing protein [Cellulomons edaphi]